MCDRRNGPAALLGERKGFNMTDNAIIKRDHEWMHDPINSRFFIRRHPVIGTVVLLAVIVFLGYQYFFWWRYKPVEISEANFPDPVFRREIARFDDDEDGVLSVAELRNVTEIDVSCARMRYLDEDGALRVQGDGEPITSLKGIEYFMALETLNCANNDLS